MFHIFYPSKAEAYTVQSNTDPLTAKKRRTLTKYEWCMAFNTFIEVYIPKHPDDIQGLLAYVSYVQAIMGWGPLNKGAGDWNFYNVRFRQEREYTHCSWLMLRPDLEAKAYLGTGSQSMSFRDSKQIHSSIPKVYCFDFHTKGTWCQRDQCPYDHGCVKCGKKHPGYTWCNRNNEKMQAREPNSPSRINPSTANQ